MRRPLNLWRAFDRIPGLLAVPAVWRHEAGEDYELVHPHLQPTEMVGALYPCPHSFGECPRKIVDYGDDEFAAVCRDPLRSCETLPLEPREALLHELDLNGFFQPVLQAAAIRPEPLRERMPGIWTAGLSDRPASQNQVAFLIISPTRTAFDVTVRRLLLESAGTFILIAPTNRNRTTTLQEQLQKHNVAYLSLEDQMGIDNSGRFVCASVGEAATTTADITIDGPVERSVGSAEAAAAVRQYINAKAITLTAFGIEIGTTERTVRRFLKDGRMRRANFEAMANAIGITAEQLLRGELPASINPSKRR